MRVGLIVDSVCDLPHSFITENNIFILPVTFTIDGETIIDDHDPQKAKQFHESGLLSRGHSAETQPYSVDQIYKLFLDKVVGQYDFAFLETVSRERSQTYENASQAMSRIMADYRPYRAAAGTEGPFSMRVVDSGTLFAGQGLLAAHTVHLIKQGISKPELRSKVSDFTKHIYSCLVPRDLYYNRNRARQRGDKSVPFLTTFVAKALSIFPVIWGNKAEGNTVAKARSFASAAQQIFEYAVKKVNEGLLSPYVCIPTACRMTSLRPCPGWKG